MVNEIAALQWRLDDGRKDNRIDAKHRQYLVDRLGALRAEMALSGTDNNEAIDKLKTELAETIGLIEIWAKTERDLLRSFELAQNEQARENNLKKLDELAQISEPEREARQAYAAQVVHLVKLSVELRELIDRRAQLHNELLAASRLDTSFRLPERGSGWLPEFSSAWLGSVGGLRAARAALDDLDN
jgi:hypothetical protein